MYRSLYCSIGILISSYFGFYFIVRIVLAFIIRLRFKIVVFLSNLVLCTKHSALKRWKLCSVGQKYGNFLLKQKYIHNRTYIFIDEHTCAVWYFTSKLSPWSNSPEAKLENRSLTLCFLSTTVRAYHGFNTLFCVLILAQTKTIFITIKFAYIFYCKAKQNMYILYDFKKWSVFRVSVSG